MHCRSLPWGLILQNFHPRNKAKTDEKGGRKGPLLNRLEFNTIQKRLPRCN
ncbi:unknown [Porphyromonas sp. CAG:1061]|nr:unknown [Porphyromonas sp. CAG:1061]